MKIEEAYQIIQDNDCDILRLTGDGYSDMMTEPISTEEEMDYFWTELIWRIDTIINSHFADHPEITPIAIIQICINTWIETGQGLTEKFRQDMLKFYIKMDWNKYRNYNEKEMATMPGKKELR